MSEIKLDAEQEQEARKLAAELWQRASVCEDIADEVIALRRVAEAAKVVASRSEYDPPIEPHPVLVLRAALRDAGRLP